SSNLIIGMRASIIVEGAQKGTIIKGNYCRVLMPRNAQYPYWSQVTNLLASKDVLVEENVIRDGEWILQLVEGECRNNLICDCNDHDFCRNGSIGCIHHNIFFAGAPEHPAGSNGGCIAVVYPPPPGGGIEIYNNV